MQFQCVNGVTIHYQTIGAPEGKPTLIFSNALGTDFRIWRDVIVRLVGEYHILAYDKRGHGLSDVGPTPYTIDDHASDLMGLMDHLGIHKAIFCGLSIGGLIAQHIYQVAPERVRALVLCETGHKLGDDELWNHRINVALEKGLGPLLDGVMGQWFSQGFRKPDNPDYWGYQNMFVRMPPEGYAGTCAAIRDADYTQHAASIKVPTIAVVGKQDRATPPELVQDFIKMVPGGLYQEINDTGHLLCVEKPEILAQVITAFTERLNANGPW